MSERIYCDICETNRTDHSANDACCEAYEIILLEVRLKRYKQALEKIVRRFTDAKSEGLNSIATISYELCMIANKALKESG